MAEEEFKLLAENMATIGKALELLPPEMRPAAFERMVGLLTGTTVPGPRQPVADNTEEESGDGTRARDSGSASRAGSPSRRKPRAKSKQAAATKDINFWPTGKTSFTDLVAEKAPATNHQKNLLIVSWFEEIAGLTPVGVGEVLAAYKAAGWRAPADPENSLQVTSSTKHWLDTSDMKNIKTTHGGRQHVEHDMPATATTTPRKPRTATKKKFAAKAAS